MKTIYKITLLFFVLLFSSFSGIARSIEVIKGNPKAPSAFAVFVDKNTFTSCKEEILAYRQVLQSENLGVTIFASDWQKPEEVKAEIIKLAQKTPDLEGMVFIGDIPVVRVRRGQFLTTAFKMHETKFPMIESSVTSDRFYDDLSLKFEYIGQDTVYNDHFYYNLSEEGAVALHPKYYSGRMRVPKDFPGDKNEVLKAYLRKVVAAHKEINPLDHFIYFAGHGYNSDCTTVWLQQQIAFREYFPEVFKHSSGNKFLNYRQSPAMKLNLFNELQRKETDLFFFTEHGLPDAQVINGEYPAYNYTESIEELKRSIRTQYVRRYKGKAKEAAFKKEVLEAYHLNPSVLSDEEIEKYRVKDSIAAKNPHLELEDILKLKSNPRVIVFNACYNGSFHKDGYVAAYHIFNGGNTIVAQGNTVNVLQDKFPDQLIGHLALGLRAGQWQKEVIMLESHLIGDPAFRFAPEKTIDRAFFNKLSANLSTNKQDTAFWYSLLNNSDPRLRATGIKQLTGYYLERDTKNLPAFSEKLLSLFKNDQGWTVRIEILEQLARIKDANFTQAVALSFSDPYELVRRRGAMWAGKIGDPIFIPLLADVLLYHPETQRVQYAAQTALTVFDQDKVSEFIPNQERTKKQLAGYLQAIADPEAKLADRETAIRYLRNNPLHSSIDLFLQLLNNPQENTDAQLLIAEALGWFDHSFRRNEIVAALENRMQQGGLSTEVEREIKKTIKRLK
ncbi:hypothetical protein FACS1894176_09590 [Bacteroidia bacterium]|nr:hypothetical protein FACS1894176_09590 [Bacteroidia bacterium]